MKNCSWYLWLNGKKIRNIRELRDNFDTAVLIGYFLGGSLTGWLNDINENKIIDRLSEIDLTGDIGSQLEFAFGVVPEKISAADKAVKSYIPTKIKNNDANKSSLTVNKTFSANNVPYYSASAKSSLFNSGVVLSSFGATSFESTLFTSLLLNGQALSLTSSFSALSSFLSSGSFGFYSGNSSLAIGSFGSLYMVFGSFFNMWHTMYGSMNSSSFFASSLYVSSAFYPWLFQYSIANSFFGFSGSFGSFGIERFGSSAGFLSGSFPLWMFIFGSFVMNNYALTGSLGSYGSFGSISDLIAASSFFGCAGGTIITAEEYRRTLINLSSCPLNAYGYGINLV